MQDDSFYCGAADWAKAVSQTVWNTPIAMECQESGYFHEDTNVDWLSWLFKPIGCYSKLKQH